jgi:Domain of unknown function (DUF1905)
VILEFTGDLIYWKGPSPFHFVNVPEDESDRLHDASALVTYGWGMIPVTAQIGDTEWTTSLFPKDGGYVVPVKQWVREAEGLGLGDTVSVLLSLSV